MAIIASASITLANIRDVKATYRYYKLQASTAAAPGKPTSISTLPPSGWSSTEPSYTAGSTNTLYTVDLTTFTDDTFSYSPVSVSSSYEAAKQAFNLAATAQKSADSANTAAGKAQTTADNANTAAGKAQTTADNAQKSAEEASKTATNFLSYSETSGLIISEDASTTDGWNTRIDSDGLDIRNGENVVTHYGDNVIFYDGANEEALKITDSGLRVRFKDNAVESKDSGFLASNESGNVLTWIGSGRIYQKVDETNIGYPVLEASLSAEGLDYRASDKASGTPGSSLADGYFENISPGFIGASSRKTNDDNTTQARAMIELRPNQIAVSSYTLSLDDTSKSDEKSTAITPEKVDTGEFIQNSHSLLTPENLTEDLKGNLGPNATTGKTGSHFSIIRIGQLVICSLNIQMKKNSTSKLGIIYGLPKAAYPANGALSYNGYSSSVNIFIRAGERIIYNDGTIPYDGYVGGQLIYITSE